MYIYIYMIMYNIYIYMYISLSLYIYIYIYICTVRSLETDRPKARAHTFCCVVYGRRRRRSADWCRPAQEEA